MQSNTHHESNHANQYKKNFGNLVTLQRMGLTFFPKSLWVYKKVEGFVKNGSFRNNISIEKATQLFF